MQLERSVRSPHAPLPTMPPSPGRLPSCGWRPRRPPPPTSMLLTTFRQHMQPPQAHPPLLLPPHLIPTPHPATPPVRHRRMARPLSTLRRITAGSAWLGLFDKLLAMGADIEAKKKLVTPPPLAPYGSHLHPTPAQLPCFAPRIVPYPISIFHLHRARACHSLELLTIEDANLLPPLHSPPQPSLAEFPPRLPLARRG
jgi:hypothetical protein